MVETALMGRGESPSRATTLEARRLLKSTTALMHSPSMPIYAGARRQKAVTPLSHRDTLRLSRRPVELPSARLVRVEVANRVQGTRRANNTLAAIDAAVADAAEGAEKNGWWVQNARHAAQVMPSLVEIYEAQIEALLDVATRWKVHGARRRSGLEPHPNQPNAHLLPEPLAASAHEPHFGQLHLDAGNILAELRITTCRMVQLLQCSQRAHEARKRRDFEYSEPPDSLLKTKRLNELSAGDPTTLLSRYDLKYIERSPHSNARARDSKTLWQGFNYVLKVLTDFCRVPLPTSSDPFSLHWFESAAHCPDVHSTIFEPSRWHSAEELAEFAAADAFIKKAMLGTNRTIMLNAQELALPTGVSRDWHAIAALLYGSARAFVARKAYNHLRSSASTVLAMGWRKLQIRRRAAARRAEKARCAAQRLQRWWRAQAASARRDPWLSSLSVAERRAARIERRQALERERVVTKRRVALKTSLAEYPAYDRKIRLTQSLVRIRTARRISATLRRRKLGFLRALAEHGPRLRAASLKWQRQVRRWEESSDLMWSEYRRVVNQATAFTPARNEADVLAVTGALRTRLESERAELRRSIDGISSTAALNYYRVLAAIAYNLGVVDALQGAVDEFLVFDDDSLSGTYVPPKNAVAGDNPPRAWLRAKVEELANAEDTAPQYLLGARPGPYSKNVLHSLADEAHETQCKLREMHASRRLTAHLVGLRDVLGDAAEPKAEAASSALLACITEPLFDLETEQGLAEAAAYMAAGEADGADAGGRQPPGSPGKRFRKGMVEKRFQIPAKGGGGRAGSGSGGGDSATDEFGPALPSGQVWACQLLIGLYGHVAESIGHVQARRAAEPLPLRHARALAVMHEARHGALEVLGELVAEFGLRAKCTPKHIMGRVRDELASRRANLDDLTVQFAPAAKTYSELRRLQESVHGKEGALKVVSVVDESLARDCSHLLPHGRGPGRAEPIPRARRGRAPCDPVCRYATEPSPKPVCAAAVEQSCDRGAPQRVIWQWEQFCDYGRSP
jgi:hypothetical protein